MKSLYIHIPFCRAKCPYCDFYSLAHPPTRCAGAPQRGSQENGCVDFSRVRARELQEAFVDRCVELLQTPSWPSAIPPQGGGQDRTWRTAYIGGGTPSVIAPELLSRLMRAIQCEGEFTIECNPSSVTREFSRAILEGGVNRVSMGLQSAVPEERRALGRTGDLEAVEQALALLRAEGGKNLSLDVMLGIPHQSTQSLTKTLEFCVSAGAKHISAYLLKLEPGTPFHENPPPGLPDEDMQAELYLHACQWLEACGFAQYEISNFALPGYESRHNLNYWRCGEYFAIGPGAHGFTHGRRWHYARDLDGFLRGAPPIDDGVGGDFDERAMLALRLTEGISPASPLLRERADALKGYVISDEKGLRLTREGFLLSNTIIGKLLS